MDLKPFNDASNAAQSVAYTGTAGSTTGWKLGPKVVLVWATSDCYVRVGESVTATTSDTPLPAFVPLTFAVPDDVVASFRVSAIQISAGGTVYAKPMGGA